MKINFKFYISAFLLIIVVCSCSAADNDMTAYLIHELHKAEISDVPLHVTNTAEYLPLAMRYIQNFGFDEHADALLKCGLSAKPSNYSHLVNYYLKELLKANNRILQLQGELEEQKKVNSEQQLSYQQMKSYLIKWLLFFSTFSPY